MSLTGCHARLPQEAVDKSFRSAINNCYTLSDLKLLKPLFLLKFFKIKTTVNQQNDSVRKSKV